MSYLVTVYATYASVLWIWLFCRERPKTFAEFAAFAAIGAFWPAFILWAAWSGRKC